MNRVHTPPKISLTQIMAPIADDLKLFQLEFERALKSEYRLINTMVKYVLRSRGKHLRPMLTILCAHLCGKASLDSMRAAALVELLHIATLMHDDVVDESDVRRKWPSLRRIFNNKKAVLMGDYFLAKALHNLIGLRSFPALDSLSQTAARLSSGEMLQLEKVLLGGMTEDIYYQMVGDKTASLFATACELGAITATDEVERHESLKLFGENLGIAFQIKDDLFDLIGDGRKLGKPVAFDVRRNVRTLPLIYALKQMSAGEQKTFLRTLKGHARRKELSRARQAVADLGGIEYAEDRIRYFSARALDYLAAFPSTVYKDSLTSIVEFNVGRAW